MGIVCKHYVYFKTTFAGARRKCELNLDENACGADWTDCPFMDSCHSVDMVEEFEREVYEADLTFNKKRR